MPPHAASTFLSQTAIRDRLNLIEVKPKTEDTIQKKERSQQMPTFSRVEIFP